jgi:DNA-binding XRE family transcriptional regulator
LTLQRLDVDRHVQRQIAVQERSGPVRHDRRRQFAQVKGAHVLAVDDGWPLAEATTTAGPIVEASVSQVLARRQLHAPGAPDRAWTRLQRPRLTKPPERRISTCVAPASLRRLNRFGAAVVSHTNGAGSLSGAAALFYWRSQRDVTQADLAGRIAVRRTTIWRIETGRPAFMRIGRRLANALSVQVADLIGQPPAS